MTDLDAKALERAREPKWPSGCLKPGTCERHRSCAYRPCKWKDTDIAPLIDAAVAALEGRTDGR
jgi:hypothetical protein